MPKRDLASRAGTRKGVAALLLPTATAALLVALPASPAPGAFPGDNGLIAFDSDRNDDFEIFRMNADGSDQKPLTDNDDTDYGAAFSPNAKRIAFFSTRDGDGEVFLMRANGSHEHNVSDDDAEDNEPFFTPNGKRIVFQSDRNGNYDIFVMHLDGTHVKPLTDDSADEGAPTVAADGRIAYVKNQEIWVMRADGSHEHAITEGHDDNYPNFSPDGRRIVFERRPDGDLYREIFVIRVDGKRKRRLTRNDQADFAPVFSPNGKRIAWDGGDLGNVRVMHTDGTHKRRLTLSPSIDEYADWAPKAG